MVRLYIADVSGLCISSALGKVTEERKNKALRLRSDEGKRQSLGAALIMYRAVNGGTPFDYSVCENGKPYSEGKKHFSLSHSGNYAVCAAADFEVGVDIEAPRENSQRLAERFFTEAECAAISESDAPDELFCQYWVIKESFIKAKGSGLKLPLDSFAASERIDGYSVAHMKYGSYHIAVCVKGEDIGDIEIYEELL